MSLLRKQLETIYELIGKTSDSFYERIYHRSTVLFDVQTSGGAQRSRSSTAQGTWKRKRKNPVRGKVQKSIRKYQSRRVELHRHNQIIKND